MADLTRSRATVIGNAEPSANCTDDDAAPAGMRWRWWPPLRTWSESRGAPCNWPSNTRKSVSSTATFDRLLSGRRALAGREPDADRGFGEHPASCGVGGRRVAGRRSGARRQGGQAVLRACRPHGLRDLDPGARRDRQHLGMPGARLPASCAHLNRTVARQAGRRSTLDFRDSPEEAAFRVRLRDWLAVHAKEFPTSGDEYWAKAGDWHCALYEGGFFGLSWPKRVWRPRASARLRRHSR